MGENLQPIRQHREWIAEQVNQHTRLIPELRAAQVLRTEDWGDGENVLYRKLKWDMLGRESLPPTCHRLTLGAIRAICRHPRPVVEIPEPLWLRELMHTTATVLALAVLSRGRAKFVTYAIENNTLESLFGAGKTASVLRHIVGRIYGTALSRIAYGSEASAQTYAALPWLSAVENRTILELPSRAHSVDGEQDREGALFVGRLEDRKGIRELMRAWSDIEDLVPCDLLIVGDGPHRPTVQEWVDEKPAKRRYIDHVEHRALVDIYGMRRVLVAPSKRDGRWKEQIGLPIKEALSHGLTIVTTSETGLSPWLEDNGHHVSDLKSLRAAIIRALEAPKPVAEVLASLPTVDGRQRANAWLRGVAS